MTSLNWDAIVGRFAQQVWLQTMRMLTLHQKVTILNTFMLSKIWYLASTLQPYCVHTAKITATAGTFLWRGIPARVPMQQLARRRDDGGLQLQLPALKCKALLISRHVREIDSIPYYKSFLTQDNPPPANPPADCPCLKQILQHFSRFPPQLQQNPSADLVHRFFVDQTPAPKVEIETPGENWQRVWRNISGRQLTSKQRSDLYLLVNKKIEHRQLFHRMGRANGEQCEYCNAPLETLQHKFCECPRIAAAWAVVQQYFEIIFGGWRRLTFEDFLRPSLERVSPQRRSKALALISEYITFVNQVNGRIDMQALRFHLDCIV